jgi:hypothetical protein
MKLGVFGLGLLQDGDAGIGVLPEGEELVVGDAGLGRISLQCIGPRYTEMRNCATLADRSTFLRVEISGRQIVRVWCPRPCTRRPCRHPRVFRGCDSGKSSVRRVGQHRTLTRIVFCALTQVNAVNWSGVGFRGGSSRTGDGAAETE